MADVSNAADVRSLIDKFERMCQATTGASSAARARARVRSASVSTRRAPLPPTHPSKDAKAIQEMLRRMDQQRVARATQRPARQRTASEPASASEHHEKDANDANDANDDKDDANVAEPEPEPKPAPCVEAVVKPETLLPVVVPVPKTESLTTKSATLEVDMRNLVDGDEDAKTVGSDDESDASSYDPTLRTKRSKLVAIPSSPSGYSTTSSGSMDSNSLDSLLLSLDCLLPELLHASGEPSVEAIKEAAAHSRSPSSPSKKPQPRQPASVKPKSAPVSEKAVRQTAKEPTSRTLATRTRRASLVAKAPSATTALKDAAPRTTSSRRASLSARPARHLESASPRANAPTRCRSDSTPQALPSRPVPRYLDYAHTERYAATKARNLERRRLAEQRLAARKAPPSSRTARRSRSTSWQGQLDHVRSQLFEDAAACSTRPPRSAPAKTRASTCAGPAASRPRSSGRARV